MIGNKIVSAKLGILVLMGWNLLSPMYGVGAEFTLHGTVQLEGARGPAKKKPTAFRIAAEFRNETYRIVAVATGAGWCNDEVVGSDGTNNYFLEQDWPSWKDREANRGYREFGRIGRGVFPSPSAIPVQLVWLAYYPANYFSEGENRKSIWLSNIRYAAAERQMQRVVFNRDEGLLQSVECYTTTNLLYISSKKTNIVLGYPYDNGYLLWRLRITAVTNVGNLKIPRRFEYQQFYPLVGMATNSSDLDCIYKAEFNLVDAVDSVVSGTMMPEARLKDVPVADWSHEIEGSGSGIPVIQSKLNGNQWKNPNDKSVLAQAFAIRNEMTMQHASPIKGIKKGIVIGFLTAVSFTFVWFIMKNKNMTKGQK